VRYWYTYLKPERGLRKEIGSFSKAEIWAAQNFYWNLNFGFGVVLLVDVLEGV